VERTKVILHMLDVSGAQEMGPERALEIVLEEMSAYSRELTERPQVVAANKLDVADAQRLEEARKAAERRGWDFFPISAVTGEGVAALVYRLADMVEEAKGREEPEIPPEMKYYTYDPLRGRGFMVVEEEQGFRVLGESVEKLVERMDLSNPQALAYVQARLKRMGVEDELLRMGAEEGDTVIIGDLVFDFFPEK
jgi:GTP-binding protein